MTEKTHEQMIEISGSIIDVFEDWLESKGITKKDIPTIALFLVYDDMQHMYSFVFG